MIPFTCNICGQSGCAPADRFDREVSACHCGSTVRWRSIVHTLSIALFCRSIPLPQFPHDPAISGIGLSDWSGYADLLAERLAYRNTWFHIEPRVDITAPPADLLGSLDFLISSDVFEHVPPPVDLAFEGAAALLKPRGWLILTVPYKLTTQTAEHYPDMQDFAVAELGGRRCVVVLNRDGSLMLDPEPVFHGGAGVTLEMRMLSENDVLAHLARAGFEDVQIRCEDVPEWGIYHKRDFELPILARKGIGHRGSADPR